jgi:hypothetical protein
MPLHLVTRSWTGRGRCLISLGFALLGLAAHAQDDADAALGTANGWQRYDWLKSGDDSSGTTAANGKITATTSQAVGDPFAAVSGNSIFQQNYGVTYTRPIAPDLSLSYETSAVTLNENSNASPAATDGIPDDLSQTQKVGLQLQPAQNLTLSGNLHDSMDDAGAPASNEETRGSGFYGETHLPNSSVLTFGGNVDTTTAGYVGGGTTGDDTYDAQLKQPLGKLPLTATLKGHYEETSTDGAPTTRLPSLEQSLSWKPAGTTTLEMGLRQQHYQDFPGVTNQLNEALFADWAQTVLPEVTWHSYAEVLNSRTTDLAPAAPSTSGANGTPQSADPTNSLGSLNDQTLTFSTGPSFKLDQGVSASIEYSNRIDRNPLPGDAGQEQRVSVSLKGTF